VKLPSRGTHHVLLTSTTLFFAEGWTQPFRCREHCSSTGFGHCRWLFCQSLQPQSLPDLSPALSSNEAEHKTTHTLEIDGN
jgi:hypothetical protein